MPDKTVEVYVANNNLAVDQPRVTLNKPGKEKIKWVARDPSLAQFQVDFDPFDGASYVSSKNSGGKQEIPLKGIGASAPSSHAGVTYKYTITCGKYEPLDPEVIVAD